MPSQTFNPTKDAWYGSAFANSSGELLNLLVGYRTSFFGAIKDHSSLEFDINALAGETAQAGCKIRLYLVAPAASAQAAKIRRITETFVEDSTWNERDNPNNIAWTTLGGTYTTTDEGDWNLPTSGAGAYFDIPVPTALVQDALDNQGGKLRVLLMRATEATPYAHIETESREDTNQPELVVEYAASSTEISPDPVVAQASVPAPNIDVDLNPSPVVAQAAVPDPQVEVDVAPDPVSAQASVPDPSIDVGLSPDSVPAQASVPQPSITVDLYPDPVVAQALVPAPTVETSTNIDPDPVTATAIVPAPTITVNLYPDPVVAQAAVPAPTVETVVPTPAVEQRGRVYVPSRRPSPTYHTIAVDSRIRFTGRASARALQPVAAIGAIMFAGAVGVAAVSFQAQVSVVPMVALRVDATLPVATIGTESVIRFETQARSLPYYEEDVRFVLGLPL